MSKRFLHILLVALAVWGLVISSASAETKTWKTQLGGLDVVFWHPPDGMGKQPLLLFSHGFDSCNTQSTFIMKTLAEHGYWIFAPNHDDVGCAIGTKGTLGPVVPFREPENWSDKTYEDRGDDIHLVLDGLQHDPFFKDKIDFTRIGLIGHSLGGYTMLGLAGAWPQWTPIANVKAVLVLAPYIHPFVTHHTLGGVKVPVMYQMGSADALIGDIVIKAGGAYDQTPKPKYLVELDDAGHLTWTDLSNGYNVQIIRYAEAFLDHYVKGLPATTDLTTKSDKVSAFAYDSEIGTKPVNR